MRASSAIYHNPFPTTRKEIDKVKCTTCTGYPPGHDGKVSEPLPRGSVRKSGEMKVNCDRRDLGAQKKRKRIGGKATVWVLGLLDAESLDLASRKKPRSRTGGGSTDCKVNPP